MNRLVKITVHHDGAIEDHPVWCLVSHYGNGPAPFCSGEFFGPGESDAIYEEKVLQKGGITCGRCKGMIKEIKAIKL